MTLAERITLIKAGYSRAEIAEIVEQEKAATVENIEQEKAATVETAQNIEQEKAPGSVPEWADTMFESIRSLTAAIQESNRLSVEQPEAATAASAADAALKNYMGVK